MRALALVAVLTLVAPGRLLAQGYPWQQLEAFGDETGFIRSMVVRVSIEGDAVTAIMEEQHGDGTTISLTQRARLSDLNVEAGQPRESMRAIHPHLGVVTFRCQGNAACVSYSTDTDSFFELPGPVVFGFFTRDRATAEQALADLQRLARGGAR
ncbi:MAG: hypothetical protein EXR95_03745 [Gemmatimonadetes bacterium]|nr:hypothetical protein [Gemmatimonadota bacterium]